MNTPLHIAIQNGNIEIIKALLANGCYINTRNADGQTPLELATALNNEEVIHLLLEHDADHLPPPPSEIFGNQTLAVPQRKKRITFWSALVCIILGVMAFVDIVYNTFIISALVGFLHHLEMKRVATLYGAIYMFFLLPCSFAYALCYFFWLLRLWEEVPREFARTTPAMAAGLSLIPIFGWYWMFVALGGLYRDMNRAMESRGHTQRFNAILIIAACFLWLISDLCLSGLGFVADRASEICVAHPLVFVSFFVFCILSFLMLIFTVVIYFIIHRDVLKFMDIWTHLET
ncbi:MAG: ankyrin repeat domain-containing protein [Planctomycetaceae bacterium]|nr:ankyrin repeat domain-containing protein [Planctomycetaceae bacterium]